MLDFRARPIHPRSDPPNAGTKHLGHPRTTDLRNVVNAVQYIAMAGCQWSLSPWDFPPVSTVRRCFYDWWNGSFFAGHQPPVGDGCMQI
jgi:transposase